MAFTICANQFHLAENDREGLKHETGIKDGFEEMEHKFLFGIFRPEKQDYLFRYKMFRCSRKISRWNDQKSHVPFTFQLNFRESFCKW